KFGEVNHQSHILHYDNSNPQATIIGDLCNTNTLQQNTFDCFICTQTYNFIYNFQDAIKGSHYLLKPGGTLLATMAFMSPVSKYDADRWGDYWRFAPQACSRIFTDVFGEGRVSVVPLGNSAAAALFMKGYALEEIKNKVNLDNNDEIYPLIIGLKAVK
ncbi:MAG: methyltransferase domain-containing protein, partial [Bacteroidia bacterium]|nr:methyltransferase domain-containing protein [Bacteroidia bacterium]